jgi:hypothetical protein
VPIQVDPATSLVQSTELFLRTVGASRRLDCLGSWIDNRDSVDAGFIEGILASTGISPTKITGPGTYPALAAGTPCSDQDNDGIPDAYEDAHGLNKGDPADANVVLADGYTNLEHYLNGQ